MTERLNRSAARLIPHWLDFQISSCCGWLNYTQPYTPSVLLYTHCTAALTWRVTPSPLFLDWWIYGLKREARLFPAQRLVCLCSSERSLCFCSSEESESEVSWDLSENKERFIRPWAEHNELLLGNKGTDSVSQTHTHTRTVFPQIHKHWFA